MFEHATARARETPSRVGGFRKGVIESAALNAVTVYADDTAVRPVLANVLDDTVIEVYDIVEVQGWQRKAINEHVRIERDVRRLRAVRLELMQEKEVGSQYGSGKERLKHDWQAQVYSQVHA